MKTPVVRIRTAAITLPIAITLLIAGCGIAEGTAKGAEKGQAATTSASTDQETETVDDNGVTTLGGDDDAPAAGGTVAAAQAATATAQAEESDGQPVGIQFRDGQWSVDVMVGGTAQSVTVSGDGNDVLGTGKADSTPSSSAVSQVRQTLSQALNVATRHTPGSIDKATLSGKDGVHWEVSVFPTGKTESVMLKVHGRSGDILN